MADEEREFVVDGEVFRVQLHEGGGFDCEWLSGPNAGYGFGSGAPVGYTVSSPNGAPRPVVALPQGRASAERVTNDIRVFLSMIDPNTGFIGD